MAERRHNRRSVRLRGHDYASNGAYFLTVCADGRRCIFGDVLDGVMHPNEWGRMVADEWQRSAAIRDEIVLDAFVVMPNHFHAIVWIHRDPVGATGRSPLPDVSPPPDRSPVPSVTDQSVELLRPNGPTPRSIGALMAGFKSAVTTRINAARSMPGSRIWQRNYWEHIIRGESELQRIRTYIHNNPIQWHVDQLYEAANV